MRKSERERAREKVEKNRERLLQIFVSFFFFEIENTHLCGRRKSKSLFFSFYIGDEGHRARVTEKEKNRREDEAGEEREEESF